MGSSDILGNLGKCAATDPPVPPVATDIHSPIPSGSPTPPGVVYGDFNGLQQHAYGAAGADHGGSLSTYIGHGMGMVAWDQPQFLWQEYTFFH